MPGFHRQLRETIWRGVKYLRGRGVQEVITDIGSGLNGERKGFLRLLDRVLHNEVGKVVILYEDRFTRLGFDTLWRVFEAHGTGIDVLNQVEMRSPQQELVDDLITIISHFSGKMYGLRSHKHKEVVERAEDLFAQS
jgi:putative resolvase